MTAVKMRRCCSSFPGMSHTRVCEARRGRGDLPTIVVIRCTNMACRVLSFDGALGVDNGTEPKGVLTLPCPACGHTGDGIRNGALSP